jgi:hypothetical protein
VLARHLRHRIDAAIEFGKPRGIKLQAILVTP